MCGAMLSFFEKLTAPFPERTTTAPPKGLWAFCRYYTQGMGWPLAVMSISAALLAIVEVSLFSFMGQLVDWLGQTTPEQLLSTETDTLWFMGLVTIVLLPILVFVHSAVLHQSLLGNYPMAIRWLAHRYLLRQSVSFYADDFAGRIATKVMQTSLAVRETVIKLLDVAVYIVVYFSAMLFFVGQADWRLMMPILGWLVGYIAVQRYFIPRLKAVAEQQAEARSQMTGRIVDSYTNIATIKLFSHSSREEQYARESMELFLDPVYRQMRLVTKLQVSVQLLNYGLVAVIAALSIYLWSISLISVGAIAIAVSLALRLNGMAQWIMWEVSALFENIGTVADGMNTLTKPITITDAEDANTLKVTQGRIDFNNITFNYAKPITPSHPPVLDGLSLNIGAGEKVGVVGRSGAGKSTLVNLLLRFYDVEQGHIRIDDAPINQVTQESLRQHIAMVSQDTALLHRSVRENIGYGLADATDEQIIAAAKKAEAWDFVSELEDSHGNKGLDAQVGERGVKLSGGQRQRIAIARVLLKDAPILVLDEATSALDSEVEAAIQASLDTLMENKTVIAIAHRLSTIAQMDRLVVMDKGHIVEQGTHQELIDQGGIYAQLWAHQTGGFIGTD